MVGKIKIQFFIWVLATHKYNGKKWKKKFRGFFGCECSGKESDILNILC